MWSLTTVASLFLVAHQVVCAASKGNFTDLQPGNDSLSIVNENRDHVNAPGNSNETLLGDVVIPTFRVRDYDFEGIVKTGQTCREQRTSIADMIEEFIDRIGALPVMSIGPLPFVQPLYQYNFWSFVARTHGPNDPWTKRETINVLKDIQQYLLQHPTLDAIRMDVSKPNGKKLRLDFQAVEYDYWSTLLRVGQSWPPTNEIILYSYPQFPFPTRAYVEVIRDFLQWAGGASGNLPRGLDKTFQREPGELYVKFADEHDPKGQDISRRQLVSVLNLYYKHLWAGEQEAMSHPNTVYIRGLRHEHQLQFEVTLPYQDVTAVQ